MTTTTTFIALAGAARRTAALAWSATWSSLSQAAAPSSVRPAAPAPPTRIRSRRVSSSLKRSAPRDVDRADRVLVRELVQDLARDLLDIVLVMPEVVEERLQGRPR